MAEQSGRAHRAFPACSVGLTRPNPADAPAVAAAHVVLQKLSDCAYHVKFSQAPQPAEILENGMRLLAAPHGQKTGAGALVNQPGRPFFGAVRCAPFWAAPEQLSVP